MVMCVQNNATPTPPTPMSGVLTSATTTTNKTSSAPFASSFSSSTSSTASTSSTSPAAMQRSPNEIIEMLRKLSPADSDDWILRLDNDDRKPRTSAFSTSSGGSSGSCQSCHGSLPMSQQLGGPGGVYPSRRRSGYLNNGIFLLCVDRASQKVIKFEASQMVKATLQPTFFVGKTLQDVCRRVEWPTIDIILETATRVQKSSAELTFWINGESIHTMITAMGINNPLRLRCEIIKREPQLFIQQQQQQQQQQQHALPAPPQPADARACSSSPATIPSPIDAISTIRPSVSYSRSISLGNGVQSTSGSAMDVSDDTVPADVDRGGGRETTKPAMRVHSQSLSIEPLISPTGNSDCRKISIDSQTSQASSMETKKVMSILETLLLPSPDLSDEQQSDEQAQAQRSNSLAVRQMDKIEPQSSSQPSTSTTSSYQSSSAESQQQCGMYSSATSMHSQSQYPSGSGETGYPTQVPPPPQSAYGSGGMLPPGQPPHPPVSSQQQPSAGSMHQQQLPPPQHYNPAMPSSSRSGVMTSSAATAFIPPGPQGHMGHPAMGMGPGMYAGQMPPAHMQHMQMSHWGPGPGPMYPAPHPYYNQMRPGPGGYMTGQVPPTQSQAPPAPTKKASKRKSAAAQRQAAQQAEQMALAAQAAGSAGQQQQQQQHPPMKQQFLNPMQPGAYPGGPMNSPNFGPSTAGGPQHVNPYHQGPQQPQQVPGGPSQAEWVAQNKANAANRPNSRSEQVRAELRSQIQTRQNASPQQLGGIMSPNEMARFGPSTAAGVSGISPPTMMSPPRQTPTAHPGQASQGYGPSSVPAPASNSSDHQTPTPVNQNANPAAGGGLFSPQHPQQTNPGFYPFPSQMHHLTPQQQAIYHQRQQHMQMMQVQAAQQHQAQQQQQQQAAAAVAAAQQQAQQRPQVLQQSQNHMPPPQLPLQGGAVQNGFVNGRVTALDSMDKLLPEVSVEDCRQIFQDSDFGDNIDFVGFDMMNKQGFDFSFDESRRLVQNILF